MVVFVCLFNTIPVFFPGLVIIRQSTGKNTGQNFLTHKHPEIVTFKPKNILRISPSFEIWRPFKAPPWVAGCDKFAYKSKQLVIR